MIKRELQKNEKSLLYLILVVSIFSFFLILISINSSPLSNLDNKINISMQKIQINSLVSLSKIINYVFEPTVFAVLLLAMVIFLFYKRRKVEAYALTAFTIVSIGLLELFKILVQRPRPIDALIFESDSAFPSGHALMALVFFGTLIYLFEHHIESLKAKRWVMILGIAIISIISFSRIYLNVHWFSDVIGSFALGIFLLTAFILVVHRIHIKTLGV